MDESLKNLADEYKIDIIYENNLFSIKSICEYLDTWKNYSDVEKYKLENLTIRDSLLNRNFNFKGNYDENLVYGEVTKKGVETLISKILKYKKDFSDSDVFVDVGSGSGKLILHSAIKLPIKTFIGLEIVEQRNQYAKRISEQVHPIYDKKLFFLNKDFRNFDLSFAKIIFCNNLCFSKDLNFTLMNNIPFGCHVIVSKPLNFRILKESFTLDVSWLDRPFAFHYFIK